MLVMYLWTLLLLLSFWSASKKVERVLAWSCCRLTCFESTVACHWNNTHCRNAHMCTPYLEPASALSLPWTFSFDLGEGERWVILRLLLEGGEGESPLPWRFVALPTSWLPEIERNRTNAITNGTPSWHKVYFFSNYKMEYLWQV